MEKGWTNQLIAGGADGFITQNNRYTAEEFSYINAPLRISASV